MMIPEKRYAVSLSVSSEKYGAATLANLRMKNVSKTGALLQVLLGKEHFEKGELLRLTLDLFELKKKKVVNAEIVWAEQGSIGVSFVKSDAVLDKLFKRMG